MGRLETRRRFWRIATAGIFFQGGAAAVDTGTIVAALVYGLTGSPGAVGAAAAISRYGWLFPQLFVAYYAQHRRRLPFYMLGAFGRVACLLGVALLVASSGPWPAALAVGAFFVLWTVYAFVSGVVAVPYNDIVARAVPSAAHSSLLALRFFGGGLLALGVAGVAHQLLELVEFPRGHAAMLGLGALLLLVSATSFVSAGEPDPPPSPPPSGFGRFLKEGFEVYRANGHFRLFVYGRWLEGAAAMALPFYVLQAIEAGIGTAEVAMLLGVQTAGALFSNPLWGWWGDRIGKRPLLEDVAALSILAPALALAWPTANGIASASVWFAFVFFALGAIGNGAIIAHLGYLMEISPDDRRPAYSGYFNAMVAPAALSPLAGAAFVENVGLPLVFFSSAVAAILQFLTVRRMRRLEPREARACSRA